MTKRGGREKPFPEKPSGKGDDSDAALELAAILSEHGIESILTPRFKLMGKPVKVKAKRDGREKAEAEVKRLKRRMRWYSGLAECDACNDAHQKHEGPGDLEPVEREGGT